MSTSTARPTTPIARRVVQAIAGAFFAAWISTAVVAVLGLHGAAAGIVAVALLLLGAAAGWVTSSGAGRWSPQEVRDGALGWGVIAAILLAGPFLALPMPWGVIGAVIALAFVGAVVVNVRRTAGPTSVA